MPSTYSPLKIELIATGEQSGTWGVTTNTNLGTALEEAITGSADVTFTNGNDTTVTLTDTNAAQVARNLRLNLTGSSTGAQSLILGSGCQIEKLYLINNTLGHTITVKNTTGTGVAVPAGTTMFVFNDGTNVVPAVTAVTTLTNSALTSGRVTYAGTNGLLQDSANLTFNGTVLTAANITDSSLTSGRVVVAGTGGDLADSANLTWNGSTLGVTGALTASSDSSFTSTGALLISKGTTLQQPGAPATGMVRYNTTNNQFEGYSGASPAWKSIGGSALSNDTSTASNLYPVFSNATSGTAENLYTSNAKLLYKPSTGELQASVPIASNGIFVNSQTVAASYTIAAGNSAMSSGPITVASGQTVTVSSGSRWVVL